MANDLLFIMEKLMRKNAYDWEDIGKQSHNGRDLNIAFNSRLKADEM